MARAPRAQVVNGRSGSQVLKYVVGPLRVSQRVETRALVQHIAKDNGAGGAGLRARRDYIPLSDPPGFVLRRVPGGPDSLSAEATFLHDTLAPDVYVRVEHPIFRLRPLVRKPVESAHFVRAVIRAIPRADTPVVYLNISREPPITAPDRVRIVPGEIEFTRIFWSPKSALVFKSRVLACLRATSA